MCLSLSDLSVKKVCNKIWDIEEKYDLFNKKINDIYFWKLLRFSVFQKILKEKNIYGEAHTKVSQKFIDKLLYLPRALKNNHLHSALKRNSQKDFLIFEHPRKVKVNNQYIDKYTYEFVENLNKDRYEIIDRKYNGKDYNKSTQNRSYLDTISFAFPYFKQLFIINKLSLTTKEKNLIKKLEKSFEVEFNVKVDLLNLILERIRKFNARYIYYNKLLKKRKPKKVFLVVSYNMEALIAACKENNILTIEFQHGTMSKYHLGYSFPNSKNIPYFPNQIYLFGEYWADSTPLPLPKNDLINYGFPYLEKRLEEYKDYNKKDNQALFISQGTIGNKLTKIAYKFAKNNKKYNIVYKLHPGEYNRWKDDYPILNKAIKLSNFSVIASNNINLYELFSESEYQVGVYSTAIYEGLTLGCKTILIDLPGIEYMEYLIEQDIVKVAENEIEISNLCQEYDFNLNFNKDYFFNGI